MSGKERCAGNSRYARILAAVLAVAAALALCVFALTGCGSPASSSTASGSTSSASASASSSEASGPATYVVTDGAGREVEIPTRANLERMYATSPIGQMYLVTLAPELLAGSNSTYSEAELKYMPGDIGGLPSYGTWAMNGTLDNEALIKADIQVILDVSSAAISDGDISAADELQEQTGIPVLLFSGAVDETPDTYRAIGKVLDMEDRANELADYCDKAYKDVTEAVAKVPESERVTVYYAEGPDGLKTEPENSPHFTTFKVGGAKDVADCDVTKGQGLTEVSLENVIAWNPEVIIAWSQEYRGGSDDTIRTSSDWASIKAVQDGKVYTIPCLPFTWGDRPPSVTRYIGMQWMANLLYPDVYNVDMVKVTQDYYKLFFSADLSDQDAKDILFLS